MQSPQPPLAQALRYVFAAGASPSPAAMTIIHTGLAAVVLAAVAVASGGIQPNTTPLPPRSPPNQPPVQRLLNWAAPSIQIAALELGIVAAVANAVTVVGFANSPATHGAFLFRLSAGLTPLLSVLAGDPVSPSVRHEALVSPFCLYRCRRCGLRVEWRFLAACCWQPIHRPWGASLASRWGTARSCSLPCCGACTSCVSVGRCFPRVMRPMRHTFHRHTARFDAFNLAMQQLAATAAASGVLLAIQALLSTVNIASPPRVWPSYGDNLAAWLLLFYPAFGPWAVGTWLQYAGQGRRVSPAAATIILATDPLWTALLAWLFLGAAEVHLGVLGMLGASLIVLASLVAGARE